MNSDSNNNKDSLGATEAIHSQNNREVSRWLIPEHQLGPEEVHLISRYTFNQDLWIKDVPGSQSYALLNYLSKNIIIHNPTKKIAIIVPFNYLQTELHDSFSSVGISASIYGVDQFKKANIVFDYVICFWAEEYSIKDLILFRQRSEFLILSSILWLSSMNDNELRGKELFFEKIVRNQVVELKIVQHLPYLHIFRRLSNIIRNSTSLYFTYHGCFKEASNVILRESLSEVEEANYVYRQSIKSLNREYDCSIYFATIEDIQRFLSIILHDNIGLSQDIEFLNNKLETLGIKMRCFNEFSSKIKESGIVSLLPYSCTKGVRFDYVFMPFMSSSLPFEKKQCAIYMLNGMMSSNTSVYISYSVTAHPICDEIRDYCQCVTIPPIQNDNLSSF